MKINHMQAFNELMLTGSVSGAARNLNRSQPAISALISSLEDEFGMKLFERKNGRLHPVPEAHYLHEECSELLGRIDRLQKNMQGIRALKGGRLDIACMPGPSVFLLPNMVADFALEKPDIECSLISRSSEAVFQLVAAQRYDLGIADHIVGKVDSTSLVSERHFHFDCLCAIPKGDKLAQKSVIKPRDLDNKPLATLFEGHEIHTNLRRVFSDTGQRLNLKFTTQYFIPLLTYVEKQIAYAIVDPIAVESYRLSRSTDQGLVFKPFSPVLRYTVSVLTPDYRPASRLMKSFHHSLVTKLADLGGVASG